MRGCLRYEDAQQIGGVDSLLTCAQVLIELWCQLIVVHAAAQGLRDVPLARASAIERLRPLQLYLKEQGRVWEGQKLVHFLIQQITVQKERREILNDFLELTAGQTHLVPRALTLYDIAECQLAEGDKESALKTLAYARRLFEESNHGFGQLDCFVLWTAPCADTSLAGFDGLCRLADGYKSISNYFGEFKALQLATTMAANAQNMWREVSVVLDRTKKLLEKVGGDQFLRFNYIVHLSASFQQAPEMGWTLRSLEGFFKHQPEEVAPISMGLLTDLLVQCYSKLGDLDQAVFYARKALEFYNLGTDYINKSDAAYALAHAIYNTSGSSPELLDWSKENVDLQTETPKHIFNESIELLKTWAVRDSEAGYIAGQFQKFELLTFIEFQRWKCLNHDRGLEGALHWNRECYALYALLKGPSAPPYSLGKQMDILILSAKSQHLEAFSVAGQFLRDCEKVPRAISVIEMSNAHSYAAFCLQNIYYHCSLPESAEAPASVDHDFQFAPSVFTKAACLTMAAEIGRKALELAESCGALETTIHITYQLCKALFELTQAAPSTKPVLQVEISKRFGAAVSVSDAMRRNIIATEGIKSLIQKRHVVSKPDHRSFYSFATTTFFRLGDHSSLWAWLQKVKAKAFHDLMGSRGLYTEKMLSACRDDASIAVLTQQEQILIKELQGGHDVMQASRALGDHRNEMKKIPALAQLLSISEGDFDIEHMDLSFMQAALERLPKGKKVVLVDWVILEDSTIVLLTLDSDNVLNVKQLDIKLKEIADWTKSYFTFPTDRDAPLARSDGNKVVRKLEGLVQGLEQFTNSEDLLVLCPPSQLHLVPIHALQIDRTVLIERNLIVHASSAALFRQCLLKTCADGKLKSQGLRNGVFAGVYEEPEYEDEQIEVKKCIHRTAGKFSGQSLWGTELTADILSAHLQTAGWLHYHGHAFVDQGNILGQGLILSQDAGATAEAESTLIDLTSLTLEQVNEGAGGSFGHDQSETSSDSASTIESTDAPLAARVTVADIFTMNLEETPHITIIACESGYQEMSAGDEPLGLVSALLYAGATSVLGSLWPIPSWVGRSFTEKFYSSLKEQQDRRENTDSSAENDAILNIAAAVRDAVLEIRRSPGTKQPYFWAPFVLHGAGFHA